MQRLDQNTHPFLERYPRGRGLIFIMLKATMEGLRQLMIPNLETSVKASSYRQNNKTVASMHTQKWDWVPTRKVGLMQQKQMQSISWAYFVFKTKPKKSRACICCLNRVTSRMPLTPHETYNFTYREDQVHRSTITTCCTPQSINQWRCFIPVKCQ